MTEYKKLEIHEIIKRAESGESMEGCDLSGLDLAHMDMKVAKLQNSKCVKTSFLKSDLSYADFRGCDLSGCFFIGSNLQEANFEHANCEGADFFQADLTQASFRNCNMAEANLEGTICRGTDFSGCNLFKANMRKSDLVEAILTNSFMEKADLTDAKMPPPAEAPKKDWMTRVEESKEYFKSLFMIIILVGVAILMGWLTSLSVKGDWIIPASAAAGLVIGIVISILRLRTITIDLNLDRTYYPWYFAIIVVSMFFGGLMGTITAAVFGTTWVVPASMLIGLVVGVSMIFLIERLSSKPVDRMLGRITLDEYPEMTYQSDMIHANHLLRNTRYHEALEAFLDIISRVPDKAEPRFKAARIYHTGIKDYNKAIENYEYIVQHLAPTLGKNHMYVIEAKRALKQLKG